MNKKSVEVVNDCTFTKKDYLFLVKCLDKKYLDCGNQMDEIEMRFLSLKEEAKKRWYYTNSDTMLEAKADINNILPF